MIYTVKKTLEEHGDKASEDEKKDIEAKIEALDEARKSDDTEKINSAAEELIRASHKLAEQVYQQTQPPQPEPQPAEAQQAGPDGEKVIDADFEVKD